MDLDTPIRLARVRGWAASGEALAIRERSGLTRGDICRSVGAPVTTVRRWELGERMPTGEAALRYEALLSSLQQLLVDEAI